MEGSGDFASKHHRPDVRTIAGRTLQIFEKRPLNELTPERRENPHNIMKEISSDAEKPLHEYLHIVRVSSRQTNRPNVEANTPQEYYTRTILIPFLDGMISDLNDRFSHHSETAMRISALVPAFLSEHAFEEVRFTFLYKPLLCISYTGNTYI